MSRESFISFPSLALSSSKSLLSLSVQRQNPLSSYAPRRNILVSPRTARPMVQNPLSLTIRPSNRYPIIRKRVLRTLTTLLCFSQFMSEERLETSKVSMAASKKDEYPYGYKSQYFSEKYTVSYICLPDNPSFFLAITSYFAKALEEKDVPSLKDFIRLNIDFVAGSPPNTSDFSALSGAWTHRFLSSAKLLGIAKECVLS
ncbi:hypothetical protein BC937DRAFT_87485 [Endogone sp. FLAS-F59071]|nr:hypothetical protein BC937DRAFT_87485 [Endogone sp. FLAS-F59071]|eukprot:RUS22741.1 hypothetical protein BC937DRAFT_87485 [Endogone sp. FLAS-F59071]